MTAAVGIDHPATQTILAFLARIGLPLTVAPFAGDSFLPGIRIAGGRLQLDPDRPFHPGDLLHEAGHIAVTDPERRQKLDAVPNDGGEEMAAIAWSYAACLAAGLDPAILFHDQGYRGGAQALIDNFADGRGIGVPLLAWYGLTTEAAYPAMERWLR